jgi:hypothetical protein
MTKKFTFTNSTGGAVVNHQDWVKTLSLGDQEKFTAANIRQHAILAADPTTDNDPEWDAFWNRYVNETNTVLTIS